MSLSDGVIDPHKKTEGEMFIGWAPAPKVDRRFLLSALPLAFAATSGASWLIANNLDDPGAGAWLTDATHNVTGVLTHHPYPMIRIADANAPFGQRTILLVAVGKCTSALALRDRAIQSVTAAGVLIQRKDRQMLEVAPFAQDWLKSADVPVEAALANPQTTSLGPARLAGTIMDSKCFFGVMRPGRGKTHKACASLCIRGGIPPSFWVRSRDGREQVMLMTDAAGDPVPQEILPLVADPVEAEGEIVRVGDLLQFRADVSAYRRI